MQTDESLTLAQVVGRLKGVAIRGEMVRPSSVAAAFKIAPGGRLFAKYPTSKVCVTPTEQVTWMMERREFARARLEPGNPLPAGFEVPWPGGERLVSDGATRWWIRSWASMRRGCAGACVPSATRSADHIKWNLFGRFCARLYARGVFSLLVAAFLMGLALAEAPPEWPATPAGKVLAGYLDALNSGDRAKLEAFATAYRPDRPNAVEIMLDLRWNLGGLDLYAVESSQTRSIQAVVHDREGNYHRMSVAVSDPEPPTIAKISLTRIAPPAGAPTPRRLTQQAAVAVWKAEIARSAAAGKFSGVWLWARDGKAIASGAIGKADREAGVDNTLHTRFRIGSMNKMFTAVAVLQLVEQGKLSLDDTVGKILPDYPNAGVASKVKVRHLLSHTGGTGDIFGPEFDAHRLELKTLWDYLTLYGKRDLAFEPGAKWEYSNYGFLLLGVLIEKVSGKSYYDFVAENIYRVARMVDSGSELESVAVAHRSKGYMRDRFDLLSNASTLPWRGTSAGGGYTTAVDLMRFADALLSDRLLKAETLAEATRAQFAMGDYGFGFQLGRPDEARSYGHGGGAPGMNGILRVYPESRQVVVVLGNLDPPSASRLGDWLHVRLPLK